MEHRIAAEEAHIAAEKARAAKRKQDAAHLQPDIMRLALGGPSPGDAALVRYGEAKEFVLQKSELQQLQEEVMSLRGYFSNNADDKAVVKTTTERVKQRWATDGSSRAIRERRQAVLLTLVSRLGIEEAAYKKQCAALKMLRLQIALQEGQVKKDAETAEEEAKEEIERYERTQRALKLKADNQRATLAKQQRKLEASVAALPDDEGSDHEETKEEEEANALEDAREAGEATRDKPSAEDRAFIAPEGRAH